MTATTLPSHAHGGHRHPHAGHGSHHACSQADLSVLAMLTSQSKPLIPAAQKHRKTLERRPQLDPLILETAAASGPQVTRNHYLHEFFPHATPYSRCDMDSNDSEVPVKSRYTSQQAPRRQRLARQADPPIARLPSSQSIHPLAVDRTRGSQPRNSRRSSTNDPSPMVVRRNSALFTAPFAGLCPLSPASGDPHRLPARLAQSRAPLQVTCHARTRIPTPHGHIWLHLYRNNRDDKEHLAFVIDKNQLDSTGDPNDWLRSMTLDAEWRPGETEMERIVRGAYTGKLGGGEGGAVASSPPRQRNVIGIQSPVPLVRIHSECYTGETLGSQRCDCGEQLDEALRLFSTTPPFRGIVVYLRQEGRGIGLLSKLRAYNLQDLGHDTVTANLLLGHGADQRDYEVAGGILRDFGLSQIRLLTNNPDKIESVEREGLHVAERVAMVPRQWAMAPTKAGGPKCTTRPKEARMARGSRHQGDALLGDARTMDASNEASSETDGETEAVRRRAGVGMIGGTTTRSSELDKYLRTKVERMRHMIDLPEPKNRDAHSVPALPPFVTSSLSSGLKKRRPAHNRVIAQDVPGAAEDEADDAGMAYMTCSVLATDSDGSNGPSAEAEAGCREISA